MIKIQSISISHQNSEYTVYPRIELITDCMSNKSSIYEVLCTVIKEQIQVYPTLFFEQLSSRETYIIYRHALEIIKAQTASAISLNVNTRFLKSCYVEMLLSEFGSDAIILELVESTPLKSIIQIQDRLREIKSNSRVRIWLDDFGTSRANFDVMNVIKLDGVKISKELFWDLYESDQNLLKGIIKMMKRKTNVVVIEGIDSFEKYIFCKEQQCLMQGYFFNEFKNSAVS